MHGAGRCDKHAGHNRRDQERWRGSSTQRGYDYRWQKASKEFLQRNPLCKDCYSRGRVKAATTVDHIVPHRGNEELFWDKNNWQSLCKHCHSSHKQSAEKSKPQGGA